MRAGATHEAKNAMTSSRGLDKRTPHGLLSLAPYACACALLGMESRTMMMMMTSMAVWQTALRTGMVISQRPGMAG